MERLRNAIINTAIGHGLPFYILNAILSTPQLESVQLGPSMCISAGLDPSFPKQLLLADPAISLTSFRRTLPSYERYSKSQEEVDLLGCLFNEIHHTLQIVEMPSDTAPLKAFAQNDWPCLRELVLRGGSQRKSSKAMVKILGRMPNLRILKLELAQRPGEGPHRVCPPGWVGGFPWPKLEVLTVSYPHPDDELYALSPNSLLELTLRCFPRHYVAAATGREGQFMRRRMDDSGWCSSLPSSAEILGILRRCGSSLFRLRHLDIEFEESEEDIQLLRHITTAFSTLTFFQFLRYHKVLKHHRHTASWVSTSNNSNHLSFVNSMHGRLTLGTLSRL
ncbi:hypothetical protein TRAPUB_2819 [Trametes pubescens]|uniref:F-box domain-containing protein n=1 Tax=Trametes pubescens TaxID=154538 RepID=A0A1M2VFP5_TRAPU|nr:hypothetical protein TRAPUB_2819 [Trametes pubescens]